MRNDTVEFMPLTGHVGAEVHGVNLREPLDDETFRTVHGGLLEHLVLFFRDQDITFDQHVAFARRFGELHIHPSAPCVDGRPELMKIHADATSPFAEGTVWHSDVSCDEEPPMASILYLTTVPSVGGDTLFANMYAAYDALSETMKSILAPLEALHTADIHRGRYEQIGGGLRREKHPEAIHPVIRSHPETGRKLIYVNEPFTQSIVGMKKAESDALLGFLYAHCAKPAYQCRFRWRKNSIAMWDNRCTQHHATWDYYPETRSGVWVTVKGDRPFH
jgi:taurine dioxygenase